MKKQTLFILMMTLNFLLLQACFLKKDKLIDEREFPASSIPAALNNASWFTGTLSAISFFDRDGHHLDHEYEAGREFIFYEEGEGKGRAKFWQYLGMKNYSNCANEIYTYKEGTVVFENNFFTFYPKKGNFKTIKTNCGTNSGVVTREAVGEELNAVTYRWEIKVIDGEELFYTYSEDDENLENPLFVYQKAY